jgi:hypothetical protein
LIALIVFSRKPAGFPCGSAGCADWRIGVTFAHGHVAAYLETTMKLRKTLLLALGVSAVIAAGLVSAAFKPGYVRYYYGDDHTEVVGARGTNCDGEPVSWGVVTADSTLIYTCID